MNIPRRKIMFMIDSLSMGGAEKSLISLLNQLPQDKYDIYLYRTNPNGILESEIPPYIIKRTISPHPRSTLNQFKLLCGRILHHISYHISHDSSHGAERWWKYIGRHYDAVTEHFDVAIAYHQGFPTYFVCEKINASKKVAWVNVDIRQTGYNPLFNNKFYTKYNNIITVSPSSYETFRSEYPMIADRVSIIKDIINQKSILKFAGNKSPYDSHTGIKILTVGRLVKLKGYDLAVSAAKILRDNGIKFHWYFIGDGNYKAEIEDLIKDYHLNEQVSLLGMKKNPYPYFKFCDIYVQPSLNEGYGISVAEAKLFERPIVTTAFRSAYDIIENNITGVICPMTPKDICDGIIKCIEPKLRTNLINNIRLTNSTNDSSSMTVEQVITILDQ